MQITLEQFYYLKPHHVKCVVKVIDESNQKAKVTYYLNKQRQVDWFTFDQLDEWKPKRNPEVKQCNENKREHDIVYFAKVKSDAKIPSRRREDGCYDIYACFEDDELILPPHEIVEVPTGIASSFDTKYRFDLSRERGSSGSIGIEVRCGQIDSGFRGEWFLKLTNVTNDTIIISKKVEEVTTTEVQTFSQNAWMTTVYYPYSKAVCQAALEFVPIVDEQEISYDKLKLIPSIRGIGKLGSSGK